jgi:hypothetical protein
MVYIGITNMKIEVLLGHFSLIYTYYSCISIKQ